MGNYGVEIICRFSLAIVPTLLSLDYKKDSLGYLRQVSKSVTQVKSQKGTEGEDNFISYWVFLGSFFYYLEMS